MNELEIGPITNTMRLNSLFEDAQANGHTLIAPTHYVTCGGEIRGALSFIPTVLVWMHTERNKIRDSIELRRFMENHVRAGGARVLCLPCSTGSPYYPLLPKAGYIDCGSYNLLTKAL